MDERIRIGISACLLGKEVRFDGGHKHDRFLTGSLGRWVDWVPFCPEVEVGMGTPREAVRLVDDGQRLRLVGGRSLADWTEAMERHAAARVQTLQDLCGVIFKKDSPSCGLLRVKVYPRGALEGVKDLGAPGRDGVGLFASAFLQAHPLVPAEEEGRLNDPHLREAFVERVFAYRRLRTLLEDPAFSTGKLIAFHAAHKYQLLAHAPQGYAEMGRLVASSRDLESAELKARYAELFMGALAQKAEPKRHVNVLQHILGHFKHALEKADKEEALGLIEEYRRGLVPLVVPLTLLGHWVRAHADGWLRGQTYLQPHPRELMLRNAI